ncbi:MAG: tetratricopeptide repeat protein [Dysgonomonas sp.]
MRRIFSTAILCMLVSISFAQKKAVKEANKALDSDKFSEARQLIKPALTDPETATDQETWKVAGDIEYKIFDKERDKELVKQVDNSKESPNWEVGYPGLYAAFAPYLTADSLGQLPDEKGKIKNKVRKDIVSKFIISHPYYYNGAGYYFDKKDYDKATDFFVRYWEIPSLPIFSDEDRVKLAPYDSTFQIVKYYAAISAIQANQNERAINLLNKIKSEPFFENSTYKESDVYELITSVYLQMGDTAKYIKALEDGANKYPKSAYFVPNLINEFIKKREIDKALAYLDQAIANDPSNSCELYSVKASIYAEKSEFDNSYASYDKAIAADPNCERALEGKAISYIVNAQNLKEEATKAASRKDQTDIDNKALEYYKNAYPLLEKYKSLLVARKADSKDIKAALYKLRNVYYNLNMNDEFDAVSKEYEQL